MSRTLSAGMLTAIAADTGEVCQLLELAFSSGTQRYSTSAQDISWSGNTYTAVGGAIGLESVNEVADLSSFTAQLTASGLDASVLPHILSESYIGRSAKVYLAHLDQTLGTVISTPVLMFGGYMNGGWSIECTQPSDGSAGTVTIRGQITDRLAGLDQRRGIQANVGAHQALYPGDTFFDSVGQLVGRNIVWKP